MPYKCSNSLQKIEDPSANTDSYFGDAVDISGEFYVVGVPFYDGSGLGSVHIFSSINGLWQFVQEIIGDKPTYGNDVSISGDTFIVGSQDDDGKGSVSVYSSVNGTWVLIDKLIDPEGASGNLFGYSVDMTDDTIVIGSPYDDSVNNNAGAISIFNLINGSWVHTSKITDPNGMANDFFGKSLAVTDNHIIIGAPNNDNFKGAAVIYTLQDGSWNHVEKITDPNGASMRFFGESVDIFGNTAVIGTHYHEDSGSASIFELGPTGWTQKTILVDPRLVNGKQYKNSIALSEKVVVIGHPYDDGKQKKSGSVSIFGLENDGWEYALTVTDPQGTSGDYFGNAVAISGDEVVIGAYGNGDDHGVTFIAPCMELIWHFGDMTVTFDGENKDISVHIPVQGEPDTVRATIYKSDCTTPVDDNDQAVTIFGEEYFFPYFDYNFKTHVDVAEINDSALSLFDDEIGVPSGFSKGRVMFCVKVEGVDQDSLEALSSRDYIFHTKFDLTDPIILQDFGVVPDEVDSYSETYDTFGVLACECDISTFNCINDPPAKSRSSNVEVCLTPTVEGAKIPNFSMRISNVDSSFEYDPVQYGNSGFDTSEYTDVTEAPDGSNILAVTTPLAVDLFRTDTSSTVIIYGNAVMELGAGKMPVQSFRLEIQVEEDSSTWLATFFGVFKTFYHFMSSFVKSIFLIV